jgi:hypothetical protein
MRKAIAILLTVMFLVTLTAGAVSAANYMYEKASVKGVGYKDIISTTLPTVMPSASNIYNIKFHENPVPDA